MKRKTQVRDHRMEQYMGKPSFKKLDPLNSNVDLAIYRTYRYILKDEIEPAIPVAPEAYERSSRAHTAEITFKVLREMGAEFACQEPPH